MLCKNLVYAPALAACFPFSISYSHSTGNDPLSESDRASYLSDSANTPRPSRHSSLIVEGDIGNHSFLQDLTPRAPSDLRILSQAAAEIASGITGGASDMAQSVKVKVV